MERARGIRHCGRELGRQQLRPSHAVLVKAGGLLKPSILPRRTAVRTREALRIKDANRLFEVVSHHADEITS